MISMEQLLKSIKTLCFINNGRAFDETIGHIWWIKQYSLHKGIFKTKLKCVESEMDNDRYRNMISFLSNLPNGITYTADTKKTRALPAVINPGRFEKEEYTTDFIIHVSDAYSKSIVDSNNGHRIVILPNLTSKVMESAIKFKDTIETKHSKTVEPLFDTQIKHYSSSSLRYDGFYDGVSFSYINMKPLEYDFQLLGMALAFANYGLKFLEEKEFYTIDTDKNITSASITKHTIKDNQSLNDWN